MSMTRTRTNFSRAETLFDTHAHLDFEQLSIDLDAVIERARNAGVAYILTIGSGGGVQSPARAVSIAEARRDIWATVGVHPHDAKHYSQEVLDSLRELARRPKVVALGEMGLDYAKQYSPRDLQLECFRDQLHLAQELDLPVVIHDRDAHDDTMQTLRRHGKGVTGVFHCYSGSVELAGELVRLGFYISITGVVTFRNAHTLHQVVKAIPEDRILIETDCPFLAPEPHRGRPNEPAYVRYVAEEIARIRKTPATRIAESTTANALKAFRIVADSPKTPGQD